MSATTTVMFADLTGSTGVFETLGNDAATQTITALTKWIGTVCQNHGGRVVKTLGDGALAVLCTDGAHLAARGLRAARPRRNRAQPRHR
jgi:adenylate cyclase